MTESDDHADLADGESAAVQGSGTRSYTLRNSGGIYSCSCPAWLHQSRPVHHRSCKHLRAYRGEAAEQARLAAAGLAADAAAQGVSKPAVASASAGKAPLLLLAERWEGQDPAGWWLSEKLDGVRAYWDGNRFLSRQGNPYLAPEWFVAGLPDFPLDGELWGGRKRFQRTVSIVRRADRADAWKAVRYVVFDAPAAAGTFEGRLEAVRQHFAAHEPPHAEVLAHARCEGRAQLDAELTRVEQLGGEGLMLRKAGSRYVAGRSATLLKVKRFKDAEGRVVKHQPGAGKHEGRLGSLLLELADGTRVSVGTGLSDADRDTPPPIGAIVTFRYQELTDAGVPRFPSFVRVRTDVDRLPAGSAGEVQAPEHQAPEQQQAPAQQPPAAANAAGSAATTRPKGGEKGPTTRLVFGTQKWWEVEQRGPGLFIRFGLVGKAGQLRLKSFASAEQARSEATKLIAQKRRKGYAPADD